MNRSRDNAIRRQTGGGGRTEAGSKGDVGAVRDGIAKFIGDTGGDDAVATYGDGRSACVQSQGLRPIGIEKDRRETDMPSAGRSDVSSSGQGGCNGRYCDASGGQAGSEYCSILRVKGYGGVIGYSIAILIDHGRRQRATSANRLTDGLRL